MNFNWRVRIALGYPISVFLLLHGGKYLKHYPQNIFVTIIGKSHAKLSILPLAIILFIEPLIRYLYIKTIIIAFFIKNLNYLVQIFRMYMPIYTFYHILSKQIFH
jgi:hypothetical protein